MKNKAKSMRVHPDFYKKIELERQRFMKKHKLTRLTTTAFTGILDTKLVGGNNVKRKKR